MCKWCIKHGDGGKWYFNARNYSRELADEINAVEHLEQVLRVFDRTAVTTYYGMDFAGSGYLLQMPIIGRVVRKMMNNILHNEGPKRRIIGSDGHFGQVLPIEDAVFIIENLAVEPLTLDYCMCRYMCRGEKDARCLIFGVYSEVMDKIPRYVPENVKRPLDKEDAVQTISEFSKKGFVSSVWFHPVPLIGGVCSCEDPECMGIRTRLDYGLEILYKAEYVVQANPDLCEGCKSCISVCQFSALNYSPWKDRVIVNLDRCFGCGVCRSVCPSEALTLVPREKVTAVAGQY